LTPKEKESKMKKHLIHNESEFIKPFSEQDFERKLSAKPALGERSELLIDFFKWLNSFEELQYTEKGIQFYVDTYLKSTVNPIKESIKEEKHNV